MNKDQQVNDGRLEADHMRLDYKNFTGDEEVTLRPHRKDTDVPNHPGSDIRDGPDTSDTQRDDWLLTEPLQGGTKGSDLRWSMTNRGFGPGSHWGCGGSESGTTWNPGPSTVPRAADITGRRGDYTRGGGRPAPEPQVPPGGARAVPQIFTEV